MTAEFEWTLSRHAKLNLYKRKYTKHLPFEVQDSLMRNDLYPDKWHLVNMSEEVPGAITWFPTEKDFDRDRRVRTTLGRILTKLYSVKPHIASHYSEMLKANTETAELKFAETPNEIEDVYMRGPNSCMAHPADDYVTEVHPVRVYGAGDIAVAYIENRRDRVTARTLVNKDTKEHSVIYGTSALFEQLLEDGGYKYSDEALIGCRLLLINEAEGYICPFIDGEVYVEVGSKYLHLVESVSGYQPCETNGLLYPIDTVPCECCGDRVDEDELTYMIGAGMSCPSCVDYYGIWSEYYGDYIHEDEAVHTACGHVVSTTYAVYSEARGEYLMPSNATLVNNDWVPDEDVVSDEITGFMIDREEALEYNGGWTVVSEDEWPVVDSTNEEVA